MEFGTATYGLALLAGVLSILSPCVLPIIPVVVAAAISAHRWGALALGIGLAMSFALVGVLVASAGSFIGLDADSFHTIGATLLIGFGVVLLVPALQNLFSRATGALSNSGNALLSHISGKGLTGQFLIGSALGLVWSPCVGPTLGAATTLASQGRDVGQISLLMLVFGIGAAAPLVLLGLLSRSRMMSVRGHLMSVGHHGKQVFGLLMVSFGILIITGLDKAVETWILDRSPEWLTAFTTRF